MLKKPLTDVKFKQLLEHLPAINMHEGPWITGGCARRLWQGLDWHKGDVDVFFASDTQRLTWLDQLDHVWNYTYHRKAQNTSVYDILLREYNQAQKELQAYIKLETDNAITFDLHMLTPTPKQPKYNFTKTTQLDVCMSSEDADACVQLQVIKARQAPSLAQVWADFDFNVCCFAVDSEFIYADPQAIQDADQNQITVRNSSHNKNHALRVFKYFSQGFHVPDHMVQKAIKQISDGEVDWCQQY
jgi:hypothetical protein